ncbi:hypothetical protein JNJ66_02410 [Candidatus Saccharibacteria bacterium]|nr:hypothetical protein [Candidatus Saccharibacteria bacterium]
MIFLRVWRAIVVAAVLTVTMVLTACGGAAAPGAPVVDRNELDRQCSEQSLDYEVAGAPGRGDAEALTAMIGTAPVFIPEGQDDTKYFVYVISPVEADNRFSEGDEITLLCGEEHVYESEERSEIDSLALEHLFTTAKWRDLQLNETIARLPVELQDPYMARLVDLAYTNASRGLRPAMMPGVTGIVYPEATTFAAFMERHTPQFLEDQAEPSQPKTVVAPLVIKRAPKAVTTTTPPARRTTAEQGQPRRPAAATTTQRRCKSNEDPRRNRCRR